MLGLLLSHAEAQRLERLKRCAADWESRLPGGGILSVPNASISPPSLTGRAAILAAVVKQAERKYIAVLADWESRLPGGGSRAVPSGVGVAFISRRAAET